MRRSFSARNLTFVHPHSEDRPGAPSVPEQRFSVCRHTESPPGNVSSLEMRVTGSTGSELMSTPVAMAVEAPKCSTVMPPTRHIINPSFDPTRYNDNQIIISLSLLANHTVGGVAFHIGSGFLQESGQLSFVGTLKYRARRKALKNLFFHDKRLTR
jgi:hypothetical protein